MEYKAKALEHKSFGKETLILKEDWDEIAPLIEDINLRKIGTDCMPKIFNAHLFMRIYKVSDVNLPKIYKSNKIYISRKVSLIKNLIGPDRATKLNDKLDEIIERAAYHKYVELVKKTDLTEEQWVQIRHLFIKYRHRDIRYTACYLIQALAYKQSTNKSLKEVAKDLKCSASSLKIYLGELERETNTNLDALKSVIEQVKDGNYARQNLNNERNDTNRENKQKIKNSRPITNEVNTNANEKDIELDIGNLEGINLKEIETMLSNYSNQNEETEEYSPEGEEATQSIFGDLEQNFSFDNIDFNLKSSYEKYLSVNPEELSFDFL